MSVISKLSRQISSLSVSLAEDIVALTTVSNQLLVVPLANVEMLKPEDMEPLSTTFHGPGFSGSSQITGLDTCIRKPLVVTCGLDRSVQLIYICGKTQTTTVNKMCALFSFDEGGSEFGITWIKLWNFQKDSQKKRIVSLFIHRGFTF